MPKISPVHSNVTHNINYAVDEASNTQDTSSQKTEYQGRNIVMNNESAPVVLRRGESSAAGASYQSSDLTRRHAGIYHVVDAIPPPLPPKQTLSVKETVPVPTKVNLSMGSTSASSMSDLSSTLVNQTVAIELNDYDSQLDSQRRGEVLLAKSTLVEAPDGKKFAANRVQISNKNVAIISEYPKEEYLESYLKMLLSNRTPVLVVIASNDDIAASDKGLPAYFKQDGSYGSISTKVDGKSDKQSVGKFICEEYQLKIKEGNKLYRVPVIQVNNWDESKTVDNEGLKELINHINEVKDKRIKELEKGKSSALNDPNKVLPVIHSSKGCECAGFLVATMELAKSNNTLSLEKIMTDVQASTSPNIFNKKAPGQLLTQFENVKRNKRSSDSMEDTVGDKFSVDSAKMLEKLPKTANDVEKPVSEPLLTPRKLAAEDIQKAMEQGGRVFTKLEGEFRHSGVSEGYINNIQNQRFSDIPTALATIVRAPAPNGDEVLLPANRIQINQKEVAIACQYPTLESLENYFKMLVANKTPALVVLASDKEIGTKLPKYFSQAGNYGDVSVEVSHVAERELADGLRYRDYELKLKINNINNKGAISQVTIPVTHVYNWSDRTASSNKGLIALAEHVNMLTEDSRNTHNDNSLLPVIHCRAGVGRTGQFIGTMELLKAESQQSLESIVRDMRTTRAPQMVQRPEQMQTMAVLAAELNKSILDEQI
ncbi:MAG: protein-tyrosine phosphatase family protein [Arsenophonus endosymbiont of Dermacentor nuttalli]